MTNIKTFISYLLSIISILCILSFFCEFVVSETLQGLPIFFPIVLSPIGLILATNSLKKRKDSWSLGAIIVNSILFVFPVVYMILGLIIVGV